MQVFNILQLSCGFAAIEAGGALQHMDWFESGPKLASRKHLEIRGIQQLEGCRMRWCLVGWTGCSSVLLNMGDMLGHMPSSWHWQPSEQPRTTAFIAVVVNQADCHIEFHWIQKDLTWRWTTSTLACMLHLTRSLTVNISKHNWYGFD